MQFTSTEGMSDDAPIYECASEIDHYTGHYVPYSLRRVCGFFNVPQIYYNVTVYKELCTSTIFNFEFINIIMIRYVQFIQIKYAKHGVFNTKICWLLQRILALSEHFDPSVELKILFIRI